MDGVNKFVKGDVIVGFIVIVINIIGGIVIGVVMLNMIFMGVV